MGNQFGRSWPFPPALRSFFQQRESKYYQKWDYSGRLVCMVDVVHPPPSLGTNTYCYSFFLTVQARYLEWPSFSDGEAGNSWYRGFLFDLNTFNDPIFRTFTSCPRKIFIALYHFDNTVSSFATCYVPLSDVFLSRLKLSCQTRRPNGACVLTVVSEKSSSWPLHVEVLRFRVYIMIY